MAIAHESQAFVWGSALGCTGNLLGTCIYGCSLAAIFWYPPDGTNRPAGDCFVMRLQWHLSVQAGHRRKADRSSLGAGKTRYAFRLGI